MDGHTGGGGGHRAGSWLAVSSMASGAARKSFVSRPATPWKVQQTLTHGGEEDTSCRRTTFTHQPLIERLSEEGQDAPSIQVRGQRKDGAAGSERKWTAVAVVTPGAPLQMWIPFFYRSHPASGVT